MNNGFGYVNLYYNDNYELTIKEVKEKRKKHYEIVKNLIKNFCMTI